MQRLLKTYLTVLCALCATVMLEAVPQLIDFVLNLRVDVRADFDALLVKEFLNGLPTHVQVFDDFTDFYRHYVVFYRFAFGNMLSADIFVFVGEM